MRSNVVFVILLALLGVLGVGLFTKSKTPHSVTLPSASASVPASALAASASAPSLPSASAAASAPSADAGAGLARPLRVVGLGWELVAPLALANGGLEPNKDSELGKSGLEVGIRISDSLQEVESALARGGTEADGADIAIVALPGLVTAYERLQALKPVVFFVGAWSSGSDVVLSKRPLEKLPTTGTIAIRGRADSAATMLALFGLDLSGIALENVRLGENKDAEAELTATVRAALRDEEKTDMVLSTSDASRFVPIVAVSPASLQEQHPDAVKAWTKGFLDGAQRLAKDPSAAARSISKMKDAPEPIALLSRLGETRAVDLAENAELMGLSGRDAVNLESLFQRMWRLSRNAKLTSLPPPESAPLDTRAVSSLVRRASDLPPHQSPKSGDKTPAAGAAPQPLLVARVAGPSDLDLATAELGFVAGAFHRSPLRVSAHRAGGVDKKQSLALIERTLERYGLSAARFSSGAARPRGNPQLTIEVLPVP